MNRFARVALVLAAAVLAACTQMSPSSSDAGWQTLLDGGKGFPENWQRIGDDN
jgi:hypothetical protein